MFLVPCKASEFDQERILFFYKAIKREGDGFKLSSKGFLLIPHDQPPPGVVVGALTGFFFNNPIVNIVCLLALIIFVYFIVRIMMRQPDKVALLPITKEIIRQKNSAFNSTNNYSFDDVVSLSLSPTANIFKRYTMYIHLRSGRKVSLCRSLDSTREELLPILDKVAAIIGRPVITQG